MTFYSRQYQGGNVHDVMGQTLSNRNQLFPALTAIGCLRADGTGLIPTRKH